MMRFDKSPSGYDVYHNGSEHPIGWLNETSYRSGLFCVIHNKLSEAEQKMPRRLFEAKDLITKLARA